MKQFVSLSLCIWLAWTLAGCMPDHVAFDRCKQTLSRSTRELPQMNRVEELEKLDRNVTDTLDKYGHAKMSHEMLDELRALLKEYQTQWVERYQRILQIDSLYRDRVKMMPGIGAVEFKAPPEV